MAHRTTEQTTKQWTMESASKAGLVHLLDQLKRQEWTDVGDAFRKLRFRNAVIKATERGHLSVLQWWIQSYKPSDETPNYFMIFGYAMECGHLHILQWMEQTDVLLHAPFAGEPMACNDAKVFHWLHDRNIKPEFDISLEKAAREGDLEFIQWLHGHEDVYPEVKLMQWSLALYEAAYAGHLNIVQWIHANRPDDFEEAQLHPLDGAVEGGRVEVAHWLVANTETYWIRGLNVSDMCMVQWLLEKYTWPTAKERLDWIRDTLCTAAVNGDLEIVQLLHNLHGVGNDTKPMDEAAVYGHLDMVKWLAAHNATCSSNAMDGAAKNGHLEMLQWLHTHGLGGCTAEAIKMAARNCHYYVVKWLHMAGLGQLDADVMSEAVSCGHLNIAQYVYGFGDRSQWWTGNEMKAAASRGHLVIIQWLHAHGLDGQVDADVIASNGHLDVLQYLVSLPNSNVRCTGLGALRAACFGHFDMVEWLLKQDPTLVDLRGLEKVTI